MEQNNDMASIRRYYFNPGCALSLYKPDMEQKILAYLRRSIPDVQLHKVCCRHQPGLPEQSVIINVCAGCDRRFGSLYPNVSTVSLWEVIDRMDDFPFPNYQGAEMSIQDACPVRDRPEVHRAVRSLMRKMNISVVEAAAHGSESVCCGDSLYGAVEDLQTIHFAMRRRAESMPCRDVAVYCVSCIKAMHIGGRIPRYMVDLLWGERTDPQEYRTAEWHDQLERYIDAH